MCRQYFKFDIQKENQNEICYTPSMKKHKLISFDFDGTLTTSNSWYILNTKLGISPTDDKRWYDQFVQGTITYQEWLDILVQQWLLHNPKLSFADIAEIAASSITLEPGVRQLLGELHQEGITIVITGGLDAVVESVVGEYVDAVIATNEIDCDDDGFVTGIIDVYDETQNGKLLALREYCEDRDIDLSEVIHVGDGEYDIPVFAAVGGSITFEGCSESVRAAAQHVVGSIIDIKRVLE
jgi:HAD superfamily phosphoserine phosphatase-like hydrolase